MDVEDFSDTCDGCGRYPEDLEEISDWEFEQPDGPVSTLDAMYSDEEYDDLEDMMEAASGADTKRWCPDCQ